MVAGCKGNRRGGGLEAGDSTVVLGLVFGCVYVWEGRGMRFILRCSRRAS